VKRITGALHTWGIYRLAVDSEEGYPKESILTKIDVPFVPSQSRILCPDIPVSQETLDINREWVKLPKLQKKCVFGKFAMTKIVGEDGLVLTAKQVAKKLGVEWNKFQSSWQWGVKRINSKVGL